MSGDALGGLLGKVMRIKKGTVAMVRDNELVLSPPNDGTGYPYATKDGPGTKLIIAPRAWVEAGRCCATHSDASDAKQESHEPRANFSKFHSARTVVFHPCGISYVLCDSTLPNNEVWKLQDELTDWHWSLWCHTTGG